jgi:hypothetical protein
MSGLPVGVYEVSLTTTTDERALLSNVVTVRVREGEWTDVRLTVR